MATREEKTERRWLVVRGMLVSLVLYTIVVLGLFIYKDINPLDNLNTMVFGLVGTLGLGNWMTKPAKDDE